MLCRNSDNGMRIQRKAANQDCRTPRSLICNYSLILRFVRKGMRSIPCHWRLAREVFLGEFPDEALLAVLAVKLGAAAFHAPLAHVYFELLAPEAR